MRIVEGIVDKAADDLLVGDNSVKALLRIGNECFKGLGTIG